MNEDNALKCMKCGEGLQGSVPPLGAPAEKVPNYLIPAILVTLFCCLPFGIVSIVYAAQVNGKAQAGDYAGAKNASGKAKMWMWISLSVGLLGGLIYVAVMALGIAASANH